MQAALTRRSQPETSPEDAPNALACMTAIPRRSPSAQWVGRAFEAGVRGAQFGAISWLEPTLVLLSILVTLSSALVRFSMALPRNLRRGTLNQRALTAAPPTLR
jgi:hypothetical protein